MSFQTAVLGFFKKALFWIAAVVHRGLVFLRLRRPTPTRFFLVQDVTLPASPLQYLMCELDRSLPAPHAASMLFHEQPQAWREVSAEAGKKLRAQGVGRVVFAHGTFVGHDPLSIMRALKAFVPNLPAGLEGTVRRMAYRQWNMRLGDNANFLPTYPALYGGALALPDLCDLFVWSSGNYHYARLDGALSLIDKLATDIKKSASKLLPALALGWVPQRILLVGHSHAGQIFALVTQLLAEQEERAAPVLLKFLELHFPAHQVAELRTQLDSLKNQPLDFITFGSPPRYAWYPRELTRILHVVNHRGASPLAGRMHGILNTRDGDYVQQWGISGSDFVAGGARERHLNRELDPILGVGQSATVWLESTSYRRRVQSSGFTLLVDFADQSRLAPNCIATIFGHGAYTRTAHLLPLLRLCTEHLYAHEG